MNQEGPQLTPGSDNSSEWNDLIAKRLVGKAESEMRAEPRTEKETLTTFVEENQLSPDFVKIEKNLASFGFFTPSTKRVKTEKAKTLSFTKEIDGKKVEVRATIVPAALYGLPITADQDKYLALQKIITEIHQRQGRVANPIGFTSAELLRLLQKHRDSGKNYHEIEEWLKVMTSTTILSEGVVYFAQRKVWAKDIFHVFDRAVLFGQEVEPGGAVADKNYVWLSEWQLENINQNYLLPIDFETYKRLKHHIAKALVPLLQIWLYASRDEGSFEKRYDELCQVLNIRRYKYVSDIRRKFADSLDELKAHGYLADWQIQKTADRTGYKFIFRHGEKFHRDRRRRLEQKEIPPAPRQEIPKESESRGHEVAPLPGTEPQPTAPDPRLAELTRRGITPKRAHQLLANLAAGQEILDQLEWGDFLINQAEPGKFHNPSGFYIHLLKENITPPDTFESTRQRRRREEATKATQREEGEKLRLELDYHDYRKAEIDRYITTNYSETKYHELIEAKSKELGQKYKNALWNPGLLAKLAENTLRSDLAMLLPLLSFEEFCKQQKGSEVQRELTFPEDDGTSPPTTFAV